MNSRADAALVLQQVIVEGKNLDSALINTEHDKAFVQVLAYGVCRYYWQLKCIEHQLLHTPIKQHEFTVSALLLVGLYQLIYLDTEPYAAVNECVNASKQLKKTWASKLINGALRHFLREKDQFINHCLEVETAFYSHPKWLIRLLKRDYPEDWQTILIANNQHAPMTLRINSLQTDRDQYQQQLQQANITAEKTQHSHVGLRLQQPENVNQLTNFAKGYASVQDEAAQLVAGLLELKPKQHVLDACAAPGGKTCHLLETEPSITLTAIDNNKHRSQRITENLQRLQLSAKLIVADANQPEQWWDKELFDRILCDAPCSATGVIRRHPDIKLLRRVSDINDLQQQQLQLLNALWPLLKQTGILVYATCSVLRKENDGVIAEFLAQQTDAKMLTIDTSWGMATEFGRQLLPNVTDGFYYAKLIKHPPM